MRKESTILLTGGTGSFGQKFTEIILKEYPSYNIKIFSRGELLQKEMAEKFHDPRLSFYIGDVRDRDAVDEVARGCDLIVHAGALKQVPMMEHNPMEVVKTNIIGSFNVILSAIHNKIPKMIAISSDKAVKPVNIYGSTKMCMERLVIQANTHQHDTKLSCVRYGNVAGSRGSLIHYLLTKPHRVELTDERMTRFWLTLEQGVRFVIKSVKEMHGGEIFVPKIPSMRIKTLIETLCPDAEVSVTGIREGEKLNEELVSMEESRHTEINDDYFVILPERGRQIHQKREWSYNSGENDRWLTQEEMTNLSKHLA